MCLSVSVGVYMSGYLCVCDCSGRTCCRKSEGVNCKGKGKTLDGWLQGRRGGAGGGRHRGVERARVPFKWGMCSSFRLRNPPTSA